MIYFRHLVKGNATVDPMKFDSKCAYLTFTLFGLQTNVSDIGMKSLIVIC